MREDDDEGGEDEDETERERMRGNPESRRVQTRKLVEISEGRSAETVSSHSRWWWW